LLLLAVIMVASSFAPATQAAPRYGHDISWPQCPASVGGYDLPMPPTSTAFVIVGLTRGLPWTENPCLASQVAWISTHAKPAHAYTMAAFPTAAQIAQYGDDGPWSATTSAGRLSNAGYAQARFAVATLRRVGFAPPVVWIDVEPRPAQPWPAATASQQRGNRYVIEGLMRGLQEAGNAYGLYSYAAGWQSITGSWLLPGVPAWATAGRLDYPSEALDQCSAPSFSGGRVYLAQWYDSTRDYDLTCDPYAFTPLAMPPAALSGSTADFNGDWRNDVLARVSSTGDLRMYPGNGSGGWLPTVTVGTGWGVMDWMDTPGDFDGDGAPDVLARDGAGYLWLYRGDGRGGWLPRVRVGNGWSGMTALLGPGDFDGDRFVDVLARDGAGYLWLYRGDGRGGWLPRVRVGNGWNTIDALF
jgi:hypothetical protein